jgi:DNA polymerase-3 subunit beta
LNGIFLHVADDDRPVLKAAATDGHRLARVTLDRPDGAEGMPDVIVPRKCIAELRKLLDERGDSRVQVDLSASKIRFTLGSAILTSKLIDGTFPDYGRVIPSGNDKRLVVEREAFARAVDRVSTISSERGRAVKLSLLDGKLTLSVTNPDSGSAIEELEVDYDSTPLDIGFNAKYLLDITGQLSSDTALFRLADPGSPTLVQDREGSSALYVLMPMRV